MIIRIDYKQHKVDYPAKAEAAWKIKNPGRTPSWYDKDEWNGGSRWAFMDLIKELSKKHPNIIIKSPKGNGTNSSIGNFNIKAFSKRGLGIYHNTYDKTCFDMPYYTIDTIEINDNEKLLIFNDELALRYE